MFRKLLHLKTSSISSSALVVAAFTVVGALVSLLRNSLLAATFGAGQELDVYYAAFRIPDFIYSIFYMGVVSVLFLPIFNDLFERDAQRAWRFFGAMINWIVLVLGLVAVLLIFFAPVVMPLIVPGFSADQIALVVSMTRLMLIQPVILGISNIISGALQSFQRFAAAAMGHIAYNVGIVAGIVLFVPSMGVFGLAWGVVLGALAHLAVQLPSFWSIKDGMRLRLRLDTEIMRPYRGLIIPRALNVVLNQINVFAVTMLASTAAAGSLAVFNLANDIQQLPQTVIAVSFAVAAFPTLSKLAFHAREKFREILSGVAQKIFFFLIPASLFVLVFRAQLVRLILGYGKFGWPDTVNTLDALAVFAAGMLFQGLIPLFARAFFSLHNTMMPLVAALAGNVITVGLGLALLPAYGVKGLAAAVVCANIVNALILFTSLVRRGFIGAGWFLRRGALIAGVSLVGALSGRFWLEVFQFFGTTTVAGLALQTGFSILGALVVLVALFKTFGISEFDDFARAMLRRMGVSR